jgi:hypothetical protein
MEYSAYKKYFKSLQGLGLKYNKNEIDFNESLRMIYQHILVNVNEYEQSDYFRNDLIDFIIPIDRFPENIEDFHKLLKSKSDEINPNYRSSNILNCDYSVLKFKPENMELKWNNIKDQKSFIDEMVNWTSKNYGVINKHPNKFYKFVKDNKSKLTIAKSFRRKLFPLFLIITFDYNFLNFYDKINNKDILNNIYYDPILKRAFFEDFYYKAINNLCNFNESVYPNGYIIFNDLIFDFWELKKYYLNVNNKSISKYFFYKDILKLDFKKINIDNYFSFDNFYDFYVGGKKSKKHADNNDYIIRVKKNINENKEQIKKNILLIKDLIKIYAFFVIKNSKFSYKVNNKNFILFSSTFYRRKSFFYSIEDFILNNAININIYKKRKTSNILTFFKSLSLKDFFETIESYSKLFNVLIIDFPNFNFGHRDKKETKILNEILFELAKYNNTCFIIRHSYSSNYQSNGEFDSCNPSVDLESCNKDICNKFINLTPEVDEKEEIIAKKNCVELINYYLFHDGFFSYIFLIINEIENIVNDDFNIFFSDYTKDYNYKLKYKSNDIGFFISELIEYDKNSKSIKVSDLLSELKKLLSLHNNKTKVTKKSLIDCLIDCEYFRQYLNNNATQINNFKFK